MLLSLLYSLAACNAPPPAKAPAVAVKVIAVQAQGLRLHRDFAGQVSRSEETRLRTRVGGVLVGKYVHTANG